MAQFDLYRLKNGLLVVVLQTDLIGIDGSRILAPLREPDGRCSAISSASVVLPTCRGPKRTTAA